MSVILCLEIKCNRQYWTLYWNILLGRLLVKHVTDRHLYHGHACMYIPVCQYRPWLHDDSCAPSVVHVHKIKRTYARLNISQFPSGRDMYGNVMKNNVYLYSYLCSSNDDVLLCYYYYICNQHICTYIYRKENHFNLEQTFTFLTHILEHRFVSQLVNKTKWNIKFLTLINLLWYFSRKPVTRLFHENETPPENKVIIMMF